VRVAVAGSSGSIGVQTLDVVRAERDRYEVVGLGVGSSIDTLIAQALEFRPKLVAVADPEETQPDADRSNNVGVSTSGVSVSVPELPVGQALQNSRTVFTEAELTELYTPEFSEAIQLGDRGFQFHESFQYFGASAGPSGRGYYSFDIGTWHLISLNSNCGDAGGCGTTVYGGFGKLLAGAPVTPENTMFHTPLTQPPTCESRVNHCCCE
jgi:hypothetical protein